MTNDATRATATALPEINRRRFLLNTTLAGAAVAVAAPVVAAEPEIHPLARLRELHEEASKLMVVHNEWMGGEWELRIRAPHGPCPIAYKNLAPDPVKTPRERLDTAIAELRSAMEVCANGHDGGWTAFLVGNRSSGKPDITIATCDNGKIDLLGTQPKGSTVNMHVDDGSPLLADDVTGTTAYADWEKRRAQS